MRWATRFGWVGMLLLLGACTTRGGIPEIPHDPYEELNLLLVQLHGSWAKQEEGDQEIQRILEAGTRFAEENRELLLKDAVSADLDTRSLAIPALGFADGDWSVPVLTQLLDDPNPNIRHDTLGALAYLTYRDAVPVRALPLDRIRKTLDAEDWRVVTGALFFYSTAPSLSGDSVLVRRIEDFLDHPRWEVRNQAARTLTIHKNPMSGEALVEALQDRHPLVRQNAAVGVTLILKDEALPHIMPLLNDPDQKVAEEAARLVARLAPRGIRYRCPKDGQLREEAGPCPECGEPTLPAPRRKRK